jgi:G3E family GTPase
LPTHPVVCTQLNFTLGALLQSRGEDLYRMKGILAIRDLPERYVFQVRAFLGF